MIRWFLIQRRKMMIATKELIAEAKQLAQDNYETWGQYIVECYEDGELAESLEDFNSLDEWVEVRISVANIYEEREAFYE
jgi:hypothetical protein